MSTTAALTPTEHQQHVFTRTDSVNTINRADQSFVWGQLFSRAVPGSTTATSSMLRSDGPNIGSSEDSDNADNNVLFPAAAPSASRTDTPLFGFLTTSPPPAPAQGAGAEDPVPYIRCVRPRDPPASQVAEPKPDKKRRRNKKKKSLKLTIQNGSPSSSLSHDHVVKTVKMLGYTEDEIRIATERIYDSGEEFSNDSLIDTASQVQNEELEKSVLSDFSSMDLEKREPCPAGDSSESGDDVDGACALDDSAQLQLAIEKRKQELEQAIESLKFTCKVCNLKPATILLMPCGHLATCDSCLKEIARCPVSSCRKIVRGTKEVFFV